MSPNAERGRPFFTGKLPGPQKVRHELSLTPIRVKTIRALCNLYIVSRQYTDIFSNSVVSISPLHENTNIQFCNSMLWNLIRAALLAIENKTREITCDVAFSEVCIDHVSIIAVARPRPNRGTAEFFVGGCLTRCQFYPTRISRIRAVAYAVWQQNAKAVRRKGKTGGVEERSWRADHVIFNPRTVWNFPFASL